MKTHGGRFCPNLSLEKSRFLAFPLVGTGLSAAFCDGILAVEARKRAALPITAGFDWWGKRNWVVRSRSVDDLRKGCNCLISDGAKLVNEPSDILEEYKISVNFPQKK